MAAASSPHPILYGVPAETIRDLCGVTLRQAIAYKKGAAKPSAAVVHLVTLYVDGRILGERFAGWSIHGADLIDPEGHRTTQAMLRAYPFVWQLARELARGDPIATAALDGYASIATARLERERKKRDGRERSDADRGSVAGTGAPGMPPLQFGRARS